MNVFHQELLAQVQSAAGQGSKHSANDSYLSSGHQYYSVSVPIRRTIVKSWAKIHQEIEINELVTLLDSLSQADSYEERSFVGMLLEYLPQQRKQINISHLDQWLDHMVGWAEIDGICQSHYTAEEMLEDWATWRQFLRDLVSSKNINKRRACLVLLTGPVSHSADERLSQLAFTLIEDLKDEKSILITKVISWLLRSLVTYDKEEVSRYLEKNEKSLPSIAVRETKKKILTGKK